MKIKQNSLALKRIDSAGKIIYRSGQWIILVLCFLIFIYLTFQSLLYTTSIYNAPDDPSTVIMMHDNFYINAAVISIAFICGILFLQRLMDKINPKIFGAALLVYTFLLGLIWNLLTKTSPAHDSYNILSGSQQFAINDYTPLMPENDYFYDYPFQLGYAFVGEIIIRIFGDNAYFILQLLNILASVGISASLITFAILIFKKRKTVNFTILFLFGCIQPILFTTFHYGNLLGFSLSLWAMVFTCVYLKNRKKRFIIFSAVFISAGIICKSNSLIILTAICIILILDFLKTHKLANITAILISVIMGIGLNQLIIFQYEQRADVSLGGGVPKILWLDMGLQETSDPNRPGWYNPEYTVIRYNSMNKDEKAAADSGIRDIKKRISKLISSPAERANFFATKTLSQWNDPLYMSIWVSSTRGAREEPGSFVKSMYSGNAGILTENYANFYQSFIFLFASAGMLVILKRRNIRRNSFIAVLPLIFIGGFLYHLFFEAMPQYNVTYFTLFIPIAAFGFSECCEKYHDSLIGFIKYKFRKSKTKLEESV